MQNTAGSARTVINIQGECGVRKASTQNHMQWAYLRNEQQPPYKKASRVWAGTEKASSSNRASRRTGKVGDRTHHCRWFRLPACRGARARVSSPSSFRSTCANINRNSRGTCKDCKGKPDIPQFLKSRPNA